jgi:hypothetical protein
MTFIGLLIPKDAILTNLSAILWGSRNCLHYDV